MEKLPALPFLRTQFQPKLPALLQDLSLLEAVETPLEANRDSFKALFPLTSHLPMVTFRKRNQAKKRPYRVGVVFSGGQAAGGHNVISGLYDGLIKFHPESKLFGFLGGPGGLLKAKSLELTADLIAPFRNQGGFDMLGSDRTKIESEEQFQKVRESVTGLNLDGLVIIGGDDSNTNAAFLAEDFLKKGVQTSIVGVPKTIDGDLKNSNLEISFGFDTATKIYSEMIGNILRDCLSARKYYFFIKLMGRSASHIALECALQTHPNLTLIGEEVAQKKQSFGEIVGAIADLVCMRAEKGKNYGVILIPEGIIEFIPLFKSLIAELNRIDLKGYKTREERMAFVPSRLSHESYETFLMLPELVQEQILLDRDPHGNVQVSKIETELLFIEAVKTELAHRHFSGKFSAQPLFFGYEGRSAFPSNFDANYCYTLGHVAALLIASGRTGYLTSVRHLNSPVEKWEAEGVPLTSMLRFEERKGKQEAVVHKTLVDLNGKPYQTFLAEREDWALSDDYRYPGPLQFFGPPELTEQISLTLSMEQQNL